VGLWICRRTAELRRAELFKIHTSSLEESKLAAAAAAAAAARTHTHTHTTVRYASQADECQTSESSDDVGS